MATYYLPSTGGYSTNSSNVNYRIRIEHISTTNRVARVTVRVQFWRTNTGYTTYGSGTCYCTVNGTTYSSTFTSSNVVTGDSRTDFLFVAHDVPYDEYGNATVEAYAWTDTTHVSLSTGSHGGTVSLANIGTETYTLYFKGSTNDAWGYPEAITADIGTAVTIPSHTPARTGYTFSKWTTKQDGTGASYLPGSSFSASSDSYLYAQWTIQTYSVTYNANGGSGAPSSQTKTYGTPLTLSSTKPTRSGYDFKGWGTSASATTVAYSPGSSYTNNASITLYAIWTKGYTNPRITNLALYRTTSGGATSDNGTYFKLTCDWSTDLSVSSIQVRWKESSSTSWSYSNVSASGTSGSVNSVFGSGSISTEYSYDVRIIVSDSSGSTYRDGQVPGRAYTIDVYSDGKGIAFGKPSEQTNLFEVQWNAKFNSNITITGDVTMTKYDTKVGNMISDAIGNLSTLTLNDVYPVGSIYLAYNHTSPASLFGGSWTRLSGYYLYGTGSAGVVGEIINWRQVFTDTSTPGTDVVSIKISAWRRTA